MKKNVKSFIAKLLVLFMLVGLMPAIALVSGISVANADYFDDDGYKIPTDTQPSAPVEQEVGEVETAATTDSNGTAKAEVSSSDMTDAVNKAIAGVADGKAPAVKIAVKTDASAKALDVKLPSAALKTLATASYASLSIESDVADVTFDATALKAMAAVIGDDVTLDVGPSENLSTAQATALASDSTAATFDLKLTSNGNEIHSFKDGTNRGKISVSVKYTLPAGASASSVRAYYVSDAGKLERRRDVSVNTTTGKVGFTTSHFSTYAITTKALVDEFTDIPESGYYTEAVDWAVGYGITNGMGNGTFAPGEICNRGQIVTFLWRLAGEPKAAAGTVNPFTDVTAGEFYYDAVLWAVDKGITSGMTDTTFEPYTICNRGQIVTFLWRYNGKQVTGSNAFTDVDAASWYADAVNWAVANGVTTGRTATTFAPSDSCTRGDAMTFLWRANA